MEIARTRKGRPDDGCNERDVGLSVGCAMKVRLYDLDERHGGLRSRC